MSLAQAIKQGIVSAAVAYAYDYYSGDNLSTTGMAYAAIARIGDYYGKTMLLPKICVASNMPVNPEDYKCYGVGALSGGAAYTAALQLVGGGGPMQQEFLRGAGYTVASDIILRYIDPSFVSSKVFEIASSASSAVSQQLNNLEYKSRSDL